MQEIYETVVVGGGQSALACGYYLRRAKLNYVMLDDQPAPGASWRKYWDSLTLFSPAAFSSLPGWLMPESKAPFPSREEVIDYLTKYEQRYEFPIERPVQVQEVCFRDGLFEVRSAHKTYLARTVISATGTFRKPFIPNYQGAETFRKLQLHSSDYKNPEPFKDKRVLIVGGGNSGAQILAEVSKVANTTWVTLDEVTFLPDDVDGRVLFDQASARYYAMQHGKEVNPSQFHVGNIVMVPAVKDARSRGVLHTVRPFHRFYEDGVIWSDGQQEKVDAVIWCTGFGYALDHLDCMNLKDQKGKVEVEGTKAKHQAGLWLVGYGNWTGFASATLIGVGRSARQTVAEIQDFLKQV
ncbi:ArsO family NAD(P)H-dependent flavin-containing monooxygenase [Pontibacter sp. HSC-36F09]|uniref:ArsO family NAD(P)H-dependent flavin-containing monooxygenase n=1 Tax=Pontibacter sp. HSC-36F09 TaxID=2910966 RepID=UPI00209E1596|nr:ArsO family NAD(P)H-dependent flavin-containing monooxygenase [Pontibacter sp. HSC-36F09]MCP2044878.1 cation diffusion facilitator CzcD-associated flavoprotein CzcO [Pontibacter sp. HSC-36F09]